MEHHPHLRRLQSAHTPAAIRERMQAPASANHLPDAVLGALDGCVTTFAVVAGATGGQLSGNVIIMLGLANLLADGFSMAASNYSSVRTVEQSLRRVRHEEEEHIRRVPSGEREEVRQIFATKGFTGEVLEQIVEVICADRRRWIDTMLVEEHGLPLASRNALRAACATFVGFFIAGLMPLIPYFVPALAIERRFAASALTMALAFFIIGAAKSALLRHSALRGGLETLALGSVAAGLAYGVGVAIRYFYGV